MERTPLKLINFNGTAPVTESEANKSQIEKCDLLVTKNIRKNLFNVYSKKENDDVIISEGTESSSNCDSLCNNLEALHITDEKHLQNEKKCSSEEEIPVKNITAINIIDQNLENFTTDSTMLVGNEIVGGELLINLNEELKQTQNLVTNIIDDNKQFCEELIDCLVDYIFSGRKDQNVMFIKHECQKDDSFTYNKVLEPDVIEDDVLDCVDNSENNVTLTQEIYLINLDHNSQKNHNATYDLEYCEFRNASEYNPNTTSISIDEILNETDDSLYFQATFDQSNIVEDILTVKDHMDVTESQKEQNTSISKSEETNTNNTFSKSIQIEHHTDLITYTQNMADLTDKLSLQEEETEELKLQLNASQQVRATLELQLRQKEEVIIKIQSELLRQQQGHKQEVKQLKEKLEEKCAQPANTQLTEMQDSIKTLQERESKLLNNEKEYIKLLEAFDKTIASQVEDLHKFQEEHETVKRHLANLEFAFSDVHQKYERSKNVIEGFKSNEDTLRQAVLSLEETVIKCEEKYEALKACAKTQIDNANKEIMLERDQYQTEIHKFTAIIKRLEIKNSSLTELLDQKTKECSALAALCDEVTGKV